MLTLRLAWRSFLRHKRRSIITGFAIAFSLTLAIWSYGIATDGHEQMANQGIRMGAGHVVVQGKGYQLEQSLDHLVPDPQRVAQAARGLPHVTHVATRVFGEGLVAAGEHSSAVAVMGVDPPRERKASDFADKLTHGKYLRARRQMQFKNQPADILLGADLAEKLHVAVGDRVVLTVSPRGGGKTQAAAFVVSGVYRTHVNEIDGFFVQIPITDARQLLKLGQGASQVALLLDDERQTHPTLAALQAKLGPRSDLEVLPWQVALKELYDAIVLDDGSFYVMMAIVLIVICIGIFNTVLMSVVERTREFGVMMAVGTSRGRLFALVLAEALVLAVVASAVGLALGYALHGVTAHYGIDIVAIYGEEMEMAGIAFTGRMYSRLPLHGVAIWTGLIVGLVLVSAVYPAYRATRLQPVEAMRHV